MIILPAIDIKDGQCVRLIQGDYATAHRVADSPFDAATAFKAAGASWLHMVDLDGAKAKRPVNIELFKNIAASSGLKVEAGGGIRDMKTIEEYINAGVSRVILGSAAVKNPKLIRESIKEFQGKIAVGIDAKDQYVATEGWTDKSNMHFLELAKRMEDTGVSTIIYTDISRDGTLNGLNREELESINSTVSCNIIASGGVSSLEDIRLCKSLGLYGCICGKALYSKKLDLRQALREAGDGIC